MVALQDYIDTRKKEGIQVILTNPSTTVVRRMEKARIPTYLGVEWIFVRTHDAVTYVQELLLEAGKEGKAAVAPSTATSESGSTSSEVRGKKGGSIQLALGRLKGWRHKGPKKSEFTPGAVGGS